MSTRWLKTREEQRKPSEPAMLPPHLLSSSILFSKQVKCRKRCIEVSARTVHDGYVVWHRAFERPSQIRWQMLLFFFASWVFYWPGWVGGIELYLLLVRLCAHLCCLLTLSVHLLWPSRRVPHWISRVQLLWNYQWRETCQCGCLAFPPHHLLYFASGLPSVSCRSFPISIVTDNNNMPAGT